MLGGGVGPDSGDGDWKNERLSDPADFGGTGAEGIRGVVSVSSREGCDDVEAIEDDRVNDGGGCCSGEPAKGDAKTKEDASGAPVGATGDASLGEGTVLKSIENLAQMSTVRIRSLRATNDASFVLICLI